MTAGRHKQGYDRHKSNSDLKCKHIYLAAQSILVS